MVWRCESWVDRGCEKGGVNRGVIGAHNSGLFCFGEAEGFESVASRREGICLKVMLSLGE